MHTRVLLTPKQPNSPQIGGVGVDDLIASNLAEVDERVRSAAQRGGRHVTDVTLVAVSKGHDSERVAAAYAAGHRVFGESRAQELAAKAAGLPSDIAWHFIGPLQRNKVKVVKPIVRLLHSLDRDALAQSWNDGPPALVQVRLGGEPTKHGFEVADTLPAVAGAIEAGVSVIGLMTIPPPSVDPNESRRWFAELRSLRDRIQLEYPPVIQLSMGMSHDYEVAVEEGATMIRVGSAIFGPRNQR